MPGSSPVFAATRPASELMTVDLPTLGMPQISTRSGLTMPPRSGASSRQASTMRCTGAPARPSSATAWVAGWSLKCCSHSAVRCASAKSCLLSTFSAGLPRVRSASSGLPLDPGSRASSISITTSMPLTRSMMAFLVEFM